MHSATGSTFLKDKGYTSTKECKLLSHAQQQTWGSGGDFLAVDGFASYAMFSTFILGL
jgi:hypothetical protein